MFCIASQKACNTTLQSKLGREEIIYQHVKNLRARFRCHEVVVWFIAERKKINSGSLDHDWLILTKVSLTWLIHNI